MLLLVLLSFLSHSSFAQDSNSNVAVLSFAPMTPGGHASSNFKEIVTGTHAYNRVFRALPKQFYHVDEEAPFLKNRFGFYPRKNGDRSFEAQLDLAIEAIQNQTDPRLFVFLNNHGNKGWMSGNRATWFIAYRDLSQLLVQKIEKTAKPFQVNLIISSCYSGSCATSFQKRLNPQSLIKFNLLTSASNYAPSPGGNEFENSLAVGEQVLNQEHKLDLSTDAHLDDVGKLFSLVGGTLGTGDVTEHFWSNYNIPKNYTFIEKGNLILALSRRAVDGRINSAEILAYSASRVLGVESLFSNSVTEFLTLLDLESPAVKRQILKGMIGGIQSIVDRKDHHAPKLHFELQQFEKLVATANSQNISKIREVLEVLLLEYKAVTEAEASEPVDLTIKNKPVGLITQLQKECDILMKIQNISQ